MRPVKRAGTKSIWRMKTMENEKKYTQEEIMAIVDGEIRKAGLTPARELNPDEMEKVSGGHGARIFKSHKEIDEVMDIICNVWDTYGRDVAAITAYELKVTTSSGDGGNELTALDRYRHPNGFRKWLHDELDGKHDKLSMQYGCD